jgi:molybdenum cofactor cytidylyltransferase|tara:strand:- start:256 stop:858 length:603 start_codon:yes stop_codon:yes gene_type:complete
MISAILLAAGQSLRMNGENKLVREVDGIPLIKYAVKNILASMVDEIIVVVGHDEDLIKNVIGEHRKIKFVYNEDFKKDISTSIKIGLNHISKKSEAFFISLGDMPNVNQNIYNKLIKSRLKYNSKLKPQHKKEIVIPSFEGKNGNPILFSKFMKNKIMLVTSVLDTSEIIKLNKEKILNVPFDNDGIFLDFNTLDNFNSL